jgi:TatD DNase family protein
MIDTHCHLTFPKLFDRVDEVIDAAVAHGVDRMISVGTTPDDAERAKSIAERRPEVYFTAGVHPHYAPDVTDADLPRLAELAMHERCLAFGEMGVDYHYPDPPRELQHAMFNHQLEVVRYSQINKPIVIHCRKAVDDTLAMIKGSGIPGERFVFHCFTETAAEARKVLDLGAMISFTGIVTYKNAPEVREAAKLVPDDRIMIETDSPYLSPEPHRKVRPNEPRYVAATARFLAELRGVSEKDFLELTTANAELFYNIS